ncbi:porin [Erythrobacter crassostreae]|uniref:Porin n=1 Tax=Erythrobacter crassostreae TaxID=2828328 RepID=A0A9X1F345_9SPHN|nr:porin [Erythrobacter crassostrea]MBV7258799.1 hypothetical protein [Erythrobacter crassostrea]
MTRKVSYLLSAGLLAAAAVPATAQEEDALLQELAKMRAEMAQMAARVETLESELAETKAQAETNAANVQTVAVAEPASDTSIEFKGTPQITSEGGWSFKPRGRLQYDAGVVDAPDSTGREDGFGNDVRRARLGVSGDIPGGFGYKFEVDVANSDLIVTDAIISYETGNVDVQVGQFNNFQGLEELTSSLHTSFIERAAFTDAFGFIRRVGVGVTYGEGDVLVQGGVFTDNMDRLSNQNWSANGRAVYMPKFGDTQLHLGGSVHYRSYEDGNTVRYRQRPLVGFTSERFINTGNLGAESETGFGVEGAMIAGPFHAAVEGRWQNLDMPLGMDTSNFFGGYAEVGYFLTKGDTRGYKGGKFDRTKPANPVGEGGMGSLQLNLRYDRLDLNDGTIIGGTQDGYFASLVWKPTDYTMLLANYGRLEYGDAVFPTATGSRDYGADVFAVRAQIDF